MTGRYKAYSEYNSLDYPFLEKVPKHWEICPLKIVSKFRQGKLHEPYIHEDGKFICVNSRFVSTEGEKFKFCSKNLSPVENKDILMVMSDLPNGRALAKALYVQEDNNYALNQRVCAITATKIDARFLYYQLNRNEYFLSFDDGCNQTNLSNDIFKNFPTLIPSKEEQQKIANFLDYETAKIDTLIAKQEKLIELLKEKRQAVISHAVTKGLNPDALMKDSGVEWLGEMPEHWTISKVRFDFEFDKGLTITKANLVDKGIPCVNYGEIHSKFGFEVDPKIHKLKYVNDGYLKSNEKSLLNQGDIVFADTSEDLQGAGNFTQLSSDAKVFAGYHTIITRCLKDSHSRFIAYLFDSVAFRKQIQYAVKGVKVFSITQAILKNTYIWYPNKKEQSEIAEYLDIKTKKIDLLIEKQTNAIELMKERKIALISAAVTGKIDVRDWQE